MQIIHWLFKGSNNTRSRSHKERCSTIVEEEEQVKSRDLVLYGRGEAKSTFTAILPKREDSRACFYSTLQLMRLENLGYINYWQQHNTTWQATQNRGGLQVPLRRKAEAASVGCKVLPICDIATLGTAPGCGEGLEKELVQNRRRAPSRMKELLKWAPAAKSSRGGRGTKRWKVLGDSCKSSFRWDVGSCSTSSVFSPMSMPLPSRGDRMGSKNVSIASSLGSPKSERSNKAGQWITSDSDFVVLELQVEVGSV